MDAMRGALRMCLDAMDMQEKREAGVLHIPGETALCVWRDAQSAARSVLSQEPGGARTPQKTCSKCGHAWHQWDGRSMCDVDGGCLCGGDIPEPAPSPSAESDLEALQNLCDEATRGDWVAETDHLGGMWQVRSTAVGGGYTVARDCLGPEARFIAAARTALPALIAELRALRRAGGRT